MPKVHLSDIDIFYECVGHGKDTILFIHGLGSSTQDWRNQIDFFSLNYKVIAFDIRGHGKSTKTAGPYSISLFAEDTINLLNNLNVPLVHIVGLSMGGMIGFELAYNFPQYVRSLTVVNSVPYLPPQTPKTWIAIQLRFVILKLLGIRSMGRVLSKKLFPKPEHKSIRTTFIKRWSENDKESYTEALKAIVKWPGIKAVETILCPTFVLTSDQDYTSVKSKKEYSEKMKKAEFVVVEDARHCLPIEHPNFFNHTLDSFLSKITC